MEFREIDDPRLVKAMAHPLRIQILRVLSNRIMSPSEIATEIPARLPNVSYHVRVLERVGVIELVRTAPRRGATEHYYRARGRLRIPERVWEQVPETIKTTIIDAALTQAITQITAAASHGGFTRKDSLASRLSLILDEQGFRELSAVMHGAVERARDIEEASAKRLAADDHAAPEIPTGLVTMLFETSTAPRPSTDEGRHSRPRQRERKPTSKE